MQDFSISPLRMAQGFWHHRRLAVSLIEREIIGRYRGSILGILWSFFNPILLLAVYTFVFSVVFNARWTPGSSSESKGEFALVLFTGLIVFNLFAECISRAPVLIIGNTNYVKKVIFPLDILLIVAFGSAAFHMMVSLLVWVVFYFVVFGIPPTTAILFPFGLLPICLYVLGASWFLASLGVYFRDVGHVISVVVLMFMFMTPIFYPVSALPQKYQFLVMLNPLAITVEHIRGLLIWGHVPHLATYTVYLLGSVLAAWLGWAWFQKTRKGFGDVL